MSKIKNGGLDQYCAEPFEQQQFETAGVERVKSLSVLRCLLCITDCMPSSFIFSQYFDCVAAATAAYGAFIRHAKYICATKKLLNSADTAITVQYHTASMRVSYKQISVVCVSRCRTGVIRHAFESVLRSCVYPRVRSNMFILSRCLRRRCNVIFHTTASYCSAAHDDDYCDDVADDGDRTSSFIDHN